MTADTVRSAPSEIAAALDAVCVFLENVSRLPWLEHKREQIDELKTLTGDAREDYKDRFELDGIKVEEASEILLDRLGLAWPPDYVRYGAEVALLNEQLAKLAGDVIGVDWNDVSREWER
jgi:hypothetical protein